MSDAEEKEADPFMQVIQDLRNRPSVSKCEEELLEMSPEVKPEPEASQNLGPVGCITNRFLIS